MNTITNRNRIQNIGSVFAIIEGSYYPVNEKLVKDIYLNPHKYNTIFDNTANLKILGYLDHDQIRGELYQLNAEQYVTAGSEPLFRDYLEISPL
ncbi:MAG: hypothetical protein K2H37_10170 [Lachnospiraceae bacterium]|nr:hypothetical protein [Lachnospiraceae bacterium]